jgi:gliding motility-associated-like protein
MKKILLPSLLIIITSYSVLAQPSGTDWASTTKGTAQTQAATKWTVSPYDHSVFIQNNGQFDDKIQSRDKVIYAAQLGDDYAFFTAKGLVYRYDEYPKPDHSYAASLNDDPDAHGPIKPILHFVSATWEGADPNVTLIASEEKSDYYTYPYGIKANIFKKLTYKNIYPGIDLEYTFPEGKPGIKYSVIVHPGADLSKVKLKYKGASAIHMDTEGNIVISSGIGEITDHAPVTTYLSNASSVSSNYNLNGYEESFNVGNYDNTQTLVIDPWTTNPGFAAGYNKACDVDYDNLGNVYAYGSYNPYQLAKFNSAGTKLWTYNNTILSTSYYGDLAVDKTTGTTYLVEGFNFAGAQSVKINTAGTWLATYPGTSNLAEMWRAVYNPCNHQIVIAGGGTNAAYQACMLDTTMTTITPVNVLSATTALHDLSLLCMDPTGGNCYMASSRSQVYPTIFDNEMFKCPVPALVPVAWTVSDGYAFIEVASISYVPGFTGAANGMNGMAASNNWLYTYDGATLKKWNKGTGALITTVAVTGTSFAYGGLDVDVCDNVYVGENSTVEVYNSALALTTSYAMTSTVYDVVLGADDTALYTGGNGYVSYTHLTAAAITITKTRTNSSGCGCTGTASAQLNQCGNPITTGVTYAWSNGATTSSVSALCPGTYTVTITQGVCGGTPYKDTILIKGTVGGGLTVSTVQTNDKCNGNCNGSITATVSGGTLPYTYNWTPGGQTTSAITGLCAGSYTLTAKDATGCTGTVAVTITQPTVLTTTISSTATACSGNTGTATAGPSGGTPGYTYSWNPSFQTGATATALSAGTYTVTVTDNNGCTVTASVVVGGTAGETVTMNPPTNVSCFGGSNGSDVANVTGGTSPYTYSWSTIPIQTSSTATGLTAGTYTITVTDHNGCVVTSSVTITQPPVLTVTTGAPTNVLCNGGSNGSDIATGGGGTGPYSYSWSTIPIQTNANATGLTAGTYTVTATDAHGCTATASVTITQPAVLSATTTTVSATCGNADGSATANPTGGTGTYTYSWTTLPIQTTQTATNISAGTYTVTVTDANGCTFTTTATVSNISGETVTINPPTNVSCFGGSNGSATANPVGGTGTYTYSWTTIPVQTTVTATGLTAGSYAVTVTDANGCTATASVTITQPPLLTVTTGAPTNVLCNGGSNGSDIATAGGGTGAYTYSWNTIPIQTNATATGLSAGTYTITVTDANGCTATASTTITQPTLLTVTTAAPTNVLCNGGNNGSDVATAGGGTGTYTYSWNTLPVQTNATATGLSAGTYTITVTDANGCTATASTTSTQPAALTATTTTVSSTCGKANGSATANPGGGTGTYTYSWTTIPVQTTQTATNISAGTYTVTITDANGCTLTTTATVSNITGETVTINPPVNVLCNGGNNGSATPTIVGGTSPYTYSWSTIPVQTSSTATGLTAGTYTLSVTDNNGCTATASVTITQPPVLTVTTGPATNVLCNGGNNGSDLATAGGGTAPYTYSWNTLPVQTNANATGLTAGTYTITVTDANGCTATASTTITQPPALTLVASGFPVTCNGGANGQATAIPGGGTAPYTYSWSNGPATANDNNLSAGNYKITITDAKGCSIDTTVTVTQPAAIVVAFTADTISGCAPLCTNFTDGTSDPGGTITKWSWTYSDGGSDTVKDPRHCFSAPGTYNVSLTVTDNHGCTGALTINNMITVYSFPVAAFTLGPQPTTIDNPTISFTDKSTDAYGIASWLWNFADPLNDVPSTQQNPSHSYGDTGSFCATLTVTNIHGCKDSITECLIISPAYSLYIPNAFSPDGDGKNDVFMPKGQYVSNFKMYIFDRWGMMLYYTDDITKGWPGTVNGGSRVCQEDTYVYMIEATDNLGQQHKYIGKVTLLK